MDIVFKNLFHRSIVNTNYVSSKVLSSLIGEWESRATKKRTQKGRI